MSLNKVMLIGNVGRDPEVRYLDGNSANGGTATKVATFTLATTERYRDRSGELRENTEWHNIVAWRNSADVAEKFVHKGTQLFIEGRLRTRSYTDQAGTKKYTTEVVVDNLQLLGKRGDNEGSNYGQQGGYTQQQNAYQRPAQQNNYAQQAPTYSQNAAPAAPAAPVQNNYQQPAAQPQAPEQPIDLNLDTAPSDDLPF